MDLDIPRTYVTDPQGRDIWEATGAREECSVVGKSEVAVTVGLVPHKEDTWLYELTGPHGRKLGHGFIVAPYPAPTVARTVRDAEGY